MLGGITAPSQYAFLKIYVDIIMCVMVHFGNLTLAVWLPVTSQ